MKRVQASQVSQDETDVSAMATPSRMARSAKTAGTVHKISLENFLCHDKLEMTFNDQINFIIGKNGSGKSAVLTGIVVALGERASGTCRGQSMKDFVKTGKSRAVVRVTLSNKGQGSYNRETFGDYITIERTINAVGGGGYKIQNQQGKTVSTKREDLNRILAKMNLQVDNPVCILNQETAKNFLHSNDAQQKYKLFERATQMDVMSSEFSVAEDELSRSKSCMKEKIQSLEMLKTDLRKWRTKKEWYEAVNEIHDKKVKIENEIVWAQVEEYEKVAADALKKREDQFEQIEKTKQRLEEQKERLEKFEDDFRTRNDDAVEKAAEINKVRSELSEIDKQVKDLSDRQRELGVENRQLDIEKRRLINDKTDLTKEIAKLKNAHGDSEHTQRKERRANELLALKEREETLNSVSKVSEHTVEQLKGALTQIRNETQAARSDLSRVQRNLDPKVRTLAELKKADSNAYAVFGDWVPALLQRIDRASFRGAKPIGPIGAYIKVKDRSWAPVVEACFGARLHNFICSNDEDAKQLNRMLDEIVPRGRQKPHIITTTMNGQLHDVARYKVQCNPDFQSRDIHCLMDMLIIEDTDVANALIDLNHIEQILLIRDDGDARHLLTDATRVPHNCKNAITKEGNTYFPDPNYRSYFGKAQRSQYLQASVEEAIRNLEEEVENLRSDQERSNQIVKNLSQQIQNNETQLRTEENKLSSVRKELAHIREKTRTLEAETEPEPADVRALEEDLLEVDEKMEKNETDQRRMASTLEELKTEYQTARQTQVQYQRKITTLASSTEPLKDVMDQIKRKQRELKENIDKISSSLASMQSKLNAFEATYEETRLKVESETATAVELTSVRVPVTKSQKALKSELKQIVEQVAAQEKEYGSRDHVFSEYRRRKADYERALSEVSNSRQSLQKMDKMRKTRKDFIIRFRRSIETRTHFVFQSLLNTRNFEGEIRFDSHEKTLVLMVTPPGRESFSQPTPNKRSRVSGVTDIRSLSGGERSFATVCFILSLWDAIESPFRILDEFDVFMDHVNRTISMDLLIAEARENSGRQFIFLTPLGLEKQQIRSEDDLSIFKMTDPERRE